MHRLLLERRWLRAVALAALFTAACLLLAHWQWDRRTARVAEIALVQANYRATPVPLDAVLPPGTTDLPVGRTWTPVTATGTYLPGASLVVRHRAHETDGYGFEVLVPLLLTDGRVLVVDRGWVPADVAASRDAPAALPAPPSGTTTVVVRVRPGEPVDGRQAPPGQVQAIDLGGTVAAGVAASGPQGAAAAPAIITGAYGELVSETPPPAEQPPLPAVSPSLDEGPHLGYTVQWLLFAVGAWVFLVVHLRRAAYEADVAAGRRERRAEVVAHDPDRVPSDEEVEDAQVEAMIAAARDASQRQVRGR